ncbi:16S rRNA pseudouridine516 synthase [Pseudoteredinibacter isoporae]|uniref:Pseudouridine synthase n=2 Tax=Pseudoteredinibacter isoporae TaxID=570281 RepID=A0A7X0MWZ9_9GAMM|nr:pseudouridine synthase [Pseudoteredinibacter isoporae]MBB6523201.1 16S rRNA pseudouridine516 synthase [Pseudoteredinibacter isoporae]
MIRLDKFIASATELSRKQVLRSARQGLVKVNGTVQKDPSIKINENDHISIDGETVSAARPRYFVLNKPQGYVCTNQDDEHPTVLELLDEPRKDQLQICGRLDIDTTGLVLISDDGQWNHRVTSPNKGQGKCYYVCLASDISDEDIEQLRNGIRLQGEPKPCKPAEVERLFSNELNVTISEGRYHQVKRMFGAVNNRVIELHRKSVGQIDLGDLEEGEYRELSEEEAASF